MHLKSKEERDKLISLFPSKGNAFGGGITPHPPKEDKVPYIFIKKVDTSIDTQQLQLTIESRGVRVSTIQCLQNNITGKPTRTVKVLYKDKSWKLLLNLSLSFKGTEWETVKEKEVAIIQCCNCQKFRHLSKNCGNKRRCPHCGNDHPKHHCSLPANCSNCNGGHPSFSKTCPEYIKRVQCLTTQRSEQ